MNYTELVYYLEVRLRNSTAEKITVTLQTLVHPSGLGSVIVTQCFVPGEVTGELHRDDPQIQALLHAGMVPFDIPTSFERVSRGVL